MKGLKIQDPIRGIITRPRLDIDSIIDLPVNISLG